MFFMIHTHTYTQTHIYLTIYLSIHIYYGTSLDAPGCSSIVRSGGDEAK